MKTVNTQGTKGYLNYRNWIRATFMLMAAMTLMTMNTACGSKKSSNNNGTYVGPQCNGCSANQVSMTGAVARQTQSVNGAPIQVELDFYGDANALAQAQQWGVPYQGYVTATGTLHLPYSVCGMPAGSFGIQSITQGVMGRDGMGKSIEQLYMQASNGMQIQMTGYLQSSSIVGPSGRAFPNRYIAWIGLGGCEILLN